MSKHREYLLIFAGLVLATSCVDTPVSVVDPVSIDDGPLIESADGLPVHQAQNNGTVGKHPLARLVISFKIVGELSPKTPITVQLEGVATADITSGEVELALPTFAAMTRAGPGKSLKYVPNEKAPVVARWTLPKDMQAGDSWKQSVQIGGIAEEGYYQVTAFARTEGTFRKPYDHAFHEAWLYVVDGGGQVTKVFDESVFPDHAIPQPGPFEDWIGQGTSGDTQGMATANAVAAGSSRPSTFTVFFFTQDANGNDVGMKGASVRAEYIERGQHVTTITRTVPTNGIVTFPCPGYAEQHVSGRVRNTTTTEINGGHHLAYWQARYSQCGTRIDVRGARQYYLPWKYLDYAIPRIESHFGYYRSRVTFEFRDFDEDDDEPPSTYYSGRSDKIVYRGYYDNHWVSAHEFGHALQKEKLGGLWNSGCPSPHHVHRVSNYRCALQEGIADYAGNIGTPANLLPFGSWEYAHYTAPYHRGNGEIEGNVAALFHDLIDTNNEGSDRTTLRAVDVMTVFKTCRNSGGTRNDVADFVWCLENRVDTAVHRIRFPGLTAPQNPSSVRPSNWNADNIRSTWTRNVG